LSAGKITYDDLDRAGLWISNDIFYIGKENDDAYFKYDNSGISIRSQDFKLEGGTTLYIDTEKIAVGNNAISNTVSNNSTGSVIDNSGGFKY
jgi:hypothetical protein